MDLTIQGYRYIGYPERMGGIPGRDFGEILMVHAGRGQKKLSLWGTSVGERSMEDR